VINLYQGLQIVISTKDFR